MSNGRGRLGRGRGDLARSVGLFQPAAAGIRRFDLATVDRAGFPERS